MRALFLCSLLAVATPAMAQDAYLGDQLVLDGGSVLEWVADLVASPGRVAAISVDFSRHEVGGLSLAGATVSFDDSWESDDAPTPAAPSVEVTATADDLRVEICFVEDC